MSVARYRKLPTEIEAMCWDGTPLSGYELVDWTMTIVNDTYMPGFVLLGSARAAQLLGDGAEYDHQAVMKDKGATAALYVAANQAWLGLDQGEWVAKDSQGFYPIKAEVFTKTYELVGKHDDHLVYNVDREAINTLLTEAHRAQRGGKPFEFDYITVARDDLVDSLILYCAQVRHGKVPVT